MRGRLTCRGGRQPPGIVVGITVSGVPVTSCPEDVAYPGFQVVAAGGTPPYVYSIQTGTLPTGLTINSGNGIVSGTPTTAGVSAGIVIRATDALAATADLPAFSITVNSTASAPVVADQAVSYGRLSIIGYGPVELVSTGGPIVSIVLGTRTVGSAHFNTTTYPIVNTAVPSDAQYVWTGCVASNAAGDSAGFTLTINTEANTYSAATGSQVGGAAAAIGTAGSGARTIKARSGAYAFGVNTFKNRLFTNAVTLTAYTALGPVFDKIIVNNSDNVVLDGITIGDGVTTRGNILYHLGSSNLTVQNCLIQGIPFSGSGDYSASNPTANVDGISRDGSTVSNGLTLYSNEWKYLSCNINIGVAGAMVVEGNYSHDAFEDTVKCAPPNTMTSYSGKWNVLIGVIGAVTDVGAPHPDFWQFIGNWVNDLTGIDLQGNLLLHIYSRAAAQGIFLDDMGTNFFYASTKVKGNFVGNSPSSTSGIRIRQAKACDIVGNTCVKAISGTTSPGIAIGDATTSGTHRLYNNVAGSYTVGGTETDINNFVVQPAAYATAFDGPTFDADTRAEVLTQFDMLTAGILDLATNVGAIGSGYITWPTTVPGRDGSVNTAMDPTA